MKDLYLGLTKIELSRFTGSDVRVRDDGMPLAHVALAVEGTDTHNYIPDLRY